MFLKRRKMGEGEYSHVTITASSRAVTINEISFYYHFSKDQHVQSTNIKVFLTISVDYVIKFFKNNICFDIHSKQLCHSQKLDILREHKHQC